MRFDDELRAYLEGLERSVVAQSGTRARVVDEHALRAHFLARLKGLPRPMLVQHHYRVWGPRLPALARYVETLPAQVAPIDRAGAQTYAGLLVDAALDALDPDVPLVDRLELERVLAEFPQGDQDLEAYSLEVHLTTREGPAHRPRLTPLGRTYLRLRGKDAVTWLLVLELGQNQGAWDRWRVARELLAEALSTKGLLQNWSGETNEPSFDYADAMITHAGRLGVLRVTDEDERGPTEYRVPPAMRDVVEAALTPGPWHAAVAAMLEDERAAVVTSATASATDALLDQSRLVTHELRNALMPVRHHLDWIAGRVTPDVAVRLDKVRRGVMRVLDFTQQMVKAAELTREPISTVDVVDLIRDATAIVEDGEAVEVVAPSAPLAIRARRSRLAVALGNLVRNALEARAPSPAVRVSAREYEGSVRIDVDDGGPGVPPDDRERVFDEGYSTRSTGSGFGLAFVRRVVEGELGGKVWCADSDLGGARFSIELPARPEEGTR